MSKNSQAYTRDVGSQKEIPTLEKLPNNNYRVLGYQAYEISKKGFPGISHVHYLKYQIIRPYLNLYSREKSIVDIGCSAGVLGMQCLFDNFKNVNFVDHDSEYVALIDECLRFLEADCAKTYLSTVGSFQNTFEIGFAFALIHWIYSYSEKMGNLDAAIGALHKIAPQTLFIEWVSPSDPAIRDAQHIKQNSEIITDSYTKENFVTALRLRYEIVKKIGDVNATREMWYASNEPVYPKIGERIAAVIKILISKIKEKFIKKIKKIKKLFNFYGIV